MRLPIHGEIYETLDRATPFFVLWLTFFTLLTIVRIVRRARGSAPAPPREGMIASELPGLPLMLLHSAGFVLSIVHRDPISTLLFLWWGPGYVFVATTLLVRARRKAPPIDWKPFARVSSWACKLSYVIFMACYF
ncbi:hypothetical protein HY251_06615, partial [bacterium]|nr:hypothetical protein [bacterium]